MDRGPPGPHITCATFRTQRVDMHCMGRETGQVVQDAQSMPFGVSSEDDYTNSDSHDGLLTIHDQVTKQNLRRKHRSSHTGTTCAGACAPCAAA